MPRTSADEMNDPTAIKHPFPAAIQARDHRALVDTLAPDVVLHSAVTRTTFEGSETVGELYAAVIDSFEEVEVVDEFSTEGTHAFFWRGRIDGRFVEGADRLRLDEAGKVCEITVVGRPLSGLTAFLTGIGARFARAGLAPRPPRCSGRRRGRWLPGSSRSTPSPGGLPGRGVAGGIGRLSQPRSDRTLARPLSARPPPGQRTGSLNPLKYQRALVYHSAATSVTSVPPAIGSARPGSLRERTTVSFAATAP